MTFYTLFILSANSYGELCVDRLICNSLEGAYRTGNQCCGADSVYGYIITKHEQDSWSVVSESVYGCEYVISEKNDRVDILEVALV
jgi:hypothetical protein